MRFKYYLKGLGMGIIITTLIMTVSCVMHNNNLSDEEIIEKAMELGMVMPESEAESENGLFGNKDNSESERESETEGDPRTESSEVTSETESTSEPIADSEPTTGEPATQEPETGEPETQTPPTQVEITQYVLHIVWGDTPRMIATELYENGVIESATDFRDYLDDNGYAGKLRSGSYTITVGMTYEEIAKIITKS